jgi:hypothetical protein
MGRAGEPPVVDVGPVERGLADPRSLEEAKITAQMRLATSALDVRKIVDAQRAAGGAAQLKAHVAQAAAEAVFHALAEVSRKTSCSPLDVIGPALRRDVEIELVRKLLGALAPFGLGVAGVEGLSLVMDPSTETWLRAQRGSSHLAAARPAARPSSSPDEATALAGACTRCGAQVAADEHACPMCGGAVSAAPPCVACGSAIRPGSRFCVACGARAFSVPPR